MARTTTARRSTIVALVVLLAAGLALAGCARGATPARTTGTKPLPATSAPAFPVTVTDDASRTVTVSAQPERIVSLAPANTEMLAALGLEECLVGVTTYDDYPPSVKDLPKMGDFVTPNLEAIGAATPDLVVATTGVQADVLKKLEDLGAVVIAIDPQTLEGLYADIQTLGKVTGTSEQALDLVASMKSDIGDISSAVAKEPPVSAFVEIGQNPLFTVGSRTLIDEMLAAAGGANVVTTPGYVAYSLEQLVKDDPEVYFATMGTMSDPSDMAKRAGYGELSAVKNGRVFTLEDNLVTRPGPRIVDGIRDMARALHPSVVVQ
jgi:iron complex transport system substrate-binding protein